MRWISSYLSSAVAARRLSLALILALLGGLALAPMRVRAAGCTASGPASGAYTITLCITNPADGATVTGVQPVTATVTLSGSLPSLQWLAFYLDGQNLLSDYVSPYTFNLPSDRFVDGARVLAVEARTRDGFVSQRASVNLSFSNGVTQPPVNNRSFTPSAGTTPPSGQPFVLVAAGDGASGETSTGNVTNLIASSLNPNLFLYLGDVYEKGTPTEFYNWYGTPATNTYYGRFRAITNPAVGNHEYDSGPGAPGYFDYWDNVPHYYSYNVAGWHLISLDSTSQFGQTAAGSLQYQWLAQDLNANSAACTIAYFHHPVFSVGPQGSTTSMNAIWSLLAQHGVDLVLTGHDHNYQRWLPLDAAGAPSPSGITQFVVGTGGHGIQNFVRSDSRLAIGFGTEPTGFGALRLELNQDGASYQFVNTQGATLDSGSVACSGAPPDTTPPIAPSNLSATSSSAAQVDLTWSAATDNVGVAAYEIYRNGTLLATSSSATRYTDTTVSAGNVYQYQVRTRDAAGNASGFSNPATVIPPAGLFSDGFENSNLSQWTSVTNLTVQQQEVFAGAYAARGTSAGAPAYAYKQLSVAQTELYYRIYFKIISQVQTTNLLKFRTATGLSIVAIFVSNTGNLGYRNDAAGVTTFSTTSVTRGTWHELQVRALINGASGQTEVWLDGNRIGTLSKTDALGTTPIGRIQLGENSSGISYDVAFDNVAADTRFIASSDITPPNVTLTAPPDGAAISGSMLLAANATDNTAVDHVDFLVNNAIVGADTSAPYSVAWNSALAGDGPATITARAVDSSANVSISAGRTVTVDNTAPNTTIDSGPSGIIASQSASFSFSSTEAGATFTCSLDGAPFSNCATPASYTGLADGVHTFAVRATDLAGNSDSSPASRTWSVDLTGPTITSVMPAAGATGVAVTTAVTATFGEAINPASLSTSSFVLIPQGSSTPVAASASYDAASMQARLLPSASLQAGASYTAIVKGGSSGVVDQAGNPLANEVSWSFTTATAADLTPPSAPLGLTATARSSTQVDLSWTAATDNVGVTAYEIYRNGSLLTTSGAITSYSDTTVTSATTYAYTVRARDAAGNLSAPSNLATVATRSPFLFSDDFESGALTRWTKVLSLTVQQQEVYAGSYAARATSTGPASWAYQQLSATQSELYYRVRFKIVSQGPNLAYLLKFRTASGTSILGAYVSSTGKLAYRNDAGLQTVVSATPVSRGVWHTLQVRVFINGGAGQTETWLDGVRIDALSKTEALGTTPVGRVQLGDNSIGNSYDIVFDDIAVDTLSI